MAPTPSWPPGGPFAEAINENFWGRFAPSTDSDDNSWNQVHEGPEEGQRHQKVPEPQPQAPIRPLALPV